MLNHLMNLLLILIINEIKHDYHKDSSETLISLGSSDSIASKHMIDILLIKKELSQKSKNH